MSAQFIACKGEGWLISGTAITCTGGYQTYSIQDLRSELLLDTSQLSLAQRGQLIGAMIVFFALICVFKRLIKQASYS